MEREALRQTLARLHSELERADPIDTALRADLERAVEEIRDVIEREEPPEADHPVRERVEALALEFEQPHPLISEALAGVVRTLAAMGI
ncbi:MAG: DUF4404 family protein [Myxococcota bacterium]